MNEIEKTTTFLQDIASLPVALQKEAIDKKIADLVSQQLRLKQSASPSGVAVPDTSLLHRPQEPTDLHFIETLLQTLRTKRAELETIPTKEELADLFHQAMHQPLKENKDKDLLHFFKQCCRYPNLGDIQEILQSDPNFAINAPLHIQFSAKDTPPIIVSKFGIDTFVTIAVAQKDSQLLRLLHTLGADINSMINFYKTPFIIAATNHDAKMIQLLKQMGADINGLSHKCRTPFTLAVTRKDREMMQLLKDAGSNINGVDGDGYTPLTFAINYNDPELIQWLLELGADVNGIDGRGQTPLTYAVSSNNPEMVRSLKALGANINSVDAHGLTLLDVAINKNDLQMVKTVIDLGTDINVFDRKKNALYLAILAKNQPLIEFLQKECHADPKIANQLIDCNHTALLTGLYGKVAIKDTHGQNQFFELEGGDEAFATQHLLQTVTSFFSSPILTQEELPNEAREHIQTILHQTYQISNEPEHCSNEDIVATIHRGETVAISSGWEDHTISIVFSDNKIFICNRGRGRKKHAIMAYQCPSTNITSEFIAEIRNTNLANAREFVATCQQHGVLGTKLSKDCFNMRMQKVGNCSWANTKPIVQVLLYLELKKLKPTLPSSELRKEAYRIYKLWSAQVRMEATRKYALSPIENIIPEMLTKLIEKTVSSRSLTQAQKEELLTLLQQRIKEKTDLLEQAGEHFPDTEEIKAIKAAEEAHDMASLRKLLSHAYYRHNTLLVQRILSAYRLSDLPYLHAIAMKIATDTYTPPPLEDLQRLQKKDTTHQLSALLTLAIQNKDPLMVLILHKLGVNIRSMNEYGRSALSSAVLEEDQDMVQTLIELGAGSNDIDEHGQTPLTVAALTQNLKMIQLLYNLGADINMVDEEGRSALTLAQEFQNEEMIQLLTKLGAKAHQ